MKARSRLRSAAEASPAACRLAQRRTCAMTYASRDKAARCAPPPPPLPPPPLPPPPLLPLSSLRATHAQADARSATSRQRSVAGGSAERWPVASESSNASDESPAASRSAHVVRACCETKRCTIGKTGDGRGRFARVGSSPEDSAAGAAGTPKTSKGSGPSSIRASEEAMRAKKEKSTAPRA